VSDTEMAKHFLAEFIDEEYKCWQILYTERSGQIVESAIEDFKKKYYKGEIFIDIVREENPPEEFFQKQEIYLRATQKRVLFQIKIYKDDIYNKLYVAYLSSTHRNSNSYFEMLIFAKIEDGFKIITSCLSDHEGYFDYHDGIEFEELSRPIEVIKLQPPDDPADLEEYNSD
jgi:hypothetical protein